MDQEILKQKISQFQRNTAGLIDGVDYKFNEDGSINWRSIINSKYLYVNKESFQRRKETPPDSAEGVEDKDLAIMLGGLKDLAQIRGFTSVSYKPITAGNDYAAVVCQIKWIGNYETGMESVSFEDCAGANAYNTSEMTQSYLIEIATNRAFCRCVRNFLKINIVSKDELPPPKQRANHDNASPASVLAKLMKEKGRSFKEVKEKLLAEGDVSFNDFNDWSDIPGDKAFQLVERFKVLKESRK